MKKPDLKGSGFSMLEAVISVNVRLKNVGLKI